MTDSRGEPPVRVLFVISSLGGGGSERVLTELANQLAGQCEVVVATLDAGSTDTYGLAPAVHRLVRHHTTWREPARAAPPAGVSSGRSHRRPPPSLAKRLVGAVVLQVALWRLVRTERPDVVVPFLAQTILRTRIVSGLVPVIGAERTDPATEPRSRLQRTAERLLYPRLHTLVVQTHRAQEWVQTHIGRGRVTTLPNPVRLPDGTASPERSNTVVAVGRLVSSKAHDVAVRAFAATEAPDWRLEVLGSGPERVRLDQLVADLGVTDRVDLAGWTDDTTGRLSDAGLFVSASRIEGFPNALLEAMAAGLPCVVTDCPNGPAELVEDGVTGFLVPVDDVGQLRDRMQALMDDPALRQRMGAAARERAEQYRLDRVADRWQALIEQAATDGK